jgi:hypothetical protein
MSREFGVRSFTRFEGTNSPGNDPERLRERMLSINVLLNMIEDEVANPERRQFRRSH